MQTRSQARRARLIAARAERAERAAAERERIAAQRASSENAEILKFDDDSNAAHGASSSASAVPREVMAIESYEPKYFLGLKESKCPNCLMCKENINQLCLKCKADANMADGKCTVQIGTCECLMHTHCIDAWRQASPDDAKCPYHRHIDFSGREIA